MENDAKIAQFKRNHAPDGFGDECPVCGDPFDPGSAGIIWPDEDVEIDAISWVKLCSGPIPDHMREGVDRLGYDPDELVMSYVHKDDNYS